VTLKETTLNNALASPKKRKQGRISTAKSFVPSLLMVGSVAWMVGAMMKALAEGGQRRMIGALCGT
jgi:hypothetical protein